MKIIQKSYLQSQVKGNQLFNNEIQNLQMLSNSDHIIKLHEVYEDNKNYILILDLMEGQTLGAYLKNLKQNNQWIDELQIKTIIYLILKGCNEMHAKSILHRDLKPENIMFQKPNDITSLKIVDLGLSDTETAKRYFITKCGTPGYVAPEILNLRNRVQKYGKICDLFSCGCIFFKLLTQCSLFKGDTFTQVYLKNRQCEINIDQLAKVQVNRKAEDLLQRLLKADPKLRITASQALEHIYFQQISHNVITPRLNDEEEDDQIYNRVDQNYIFPEIKKPTFSYKSTSERLDQIQIQQQSISKKYLVKNESVNSFYVNDIKKGYQKIVVKS